MLARHFAQKFSLKDTVHGSGLPYLSLYPVPESRQVGDRSGNVLLPPRAQPRAGHHEVYGGGGAEKGEIADLPRDHSTVTVDCATQEGHILRGN